MKVDLTKKASLKSMRYLVDPASQEVGRLEGVGSDDIIPPDTDLVEIEIPGTLESIDRQSRKIRVLVSRPESFSGREGYLPNFLDGWSIPLPNPTGKCAHDVRPLRRGGEGSVLRYEHFSTVQSIERRMPMFVAVNIDGATERRITRTAIAWRFDGRLDVADQIGDEVYSERRNVLDRGHMVRREDPNWGPMTSARRANVDTFHFTNSCPQMASINQRVWLGLENYVLHNTRNHEMRVSVFTGPVFTEHDLPYRDVLVPKSFWKVVAVVDEDGRPSATGYEISQDEALSDLEFAFGQYETYQVSIRSVERKTSLSFGELSDYDGFSAREARTRRPERRRLEALESIQI